MERHAASGTAWEEPGRDRKLTSCRVMVCSISLPDFGTSVARTRQAQRQIKHEHLLAGAALPVSQAANC